jgi:hypothetical protein
LQPARRTTAGAQLESDEAAPVQFSSYPACTAALCVMPLNCCVGAGAQQAVAMGSRFAFSTPQGFLRVSISRLTVHLPLSMQALSPQGLASASHTSIQRV